MLSPVSFQSGASGRARARDPSGDPSLSLGLPLKGMAYNTPFWCFLDIFGDGLLLGLPHDWTNGYDWGIYIWICVFDFGYILNIWDIAGDNQQCLLVLNGYFTQHNPSSPMGTNLMATKVPTIVHLTTKYMELSYAHINGILMVM